MESQVVSVLAELEARLQTEEELLNLEHDKLRALTPEELFKYMDKLMLAVGPQTGQFLNILLKTQGGKRILEIGTSVGYSTIWLAEAARLNSGKVSTLVCVDFKQAQAIGNIRSVGLQDYVDFQLGDALSLLKTLPGLWDFVLLDLWKELYIPCFDLFYEKLAPGAIVIADNITSPPNFRPEMKAYQEHVRAKKDLESVEVGIGNGLELTRKAL